MTVTQIGRFEVDVWEPYPCWVRIRYDNGEVMKFSHKELPDLRYAVEKAIREAREKLGAQAEEAGEPR